MSITIEDAAADMAAIEQNFQSVSVSDALASWPGGPFQPAAGWLPFNHDVLIGADLLADPRFMIGFVQSVRGADALDPAQWIGAYQLYRLNVHQEQPAWNPRHFTNGS